jgi:hypothetical protein
MATFTYQLSYWLWVKLEKDEIKSTRQGDLLIPLHTSTRADPFIAEISALEAKLQELVEKTKSP